MEIRNFEREAEANRRLVEILQNQLAEKEAMINWLANRLHGILQNDWVPDCLVTKEFSVEMWKHMACTWVKKTAQEAVKKDES